LGIGKSEHLKWILLGLLGLALIAVLGIALVWSTALAIPGSGLFSLDTLLSRIEFQRRSLTLVRDYPLVGAGLGGFQMLYSTYVLLIHVGFIPHSHSLYLNVAIDQGLPGLLALLWMWGLFSGVAWRFGRGPTADKDSRFPASPLVGIAAVSLVTVLLHGLVDNALYGNGVLLLFVPLAFAVPTRRQRNHRANRRPMLYLLICFGLAVGLALLWSGKLLSLVYSNLGAVHQSQAELSVYSWPEWPIQDAVRRATDISKPVSEFERALALNPRNSTANRRLGMIELSLGEYEDALEHLEAAHAVEADSMTTKQLLGEALVVNGRLEEGRALWTGVSNELGQLQARASWYEHIGDAERATRIQQAASSR
jgi:hypothetical protein